MAALPPDQTTMVRLDGGKDGPIIVGPCRVTFRLNAEGVAADFTLEGGWTFPESEQPKPGEWVRVVIMTGADTFEMAEAMYWSCKVDEYDPAGWSKLVGCRAVPIEEPGFVLKWKPRESDDG